MYTFSHPMQHLFSFIRLSFSWLILGALAHARTHTWSQIFWAKEKGSNDLISHLSSHTRVYALSFSLVLASFVYSIYQKSVSIQRVLLYIGYVFEYQYVLHSLQPHSVQFIHSLLSIGSTLKTPGPNCRWCIVKTLPFHPFFFSLKLSFTFSWPNSSPFSFFRSILSMQYNARWNVFVGLHLRCSLLWILLFAPTTFTTLAIYLDILESDKYPSNR